ncbi:hypothetical protein QN277_026107 [Acacia crassicarpa]|uniref:Uncharacterized protein n=1 Tax=Acacia crassicarpa TaxID=499986 RepID=A0AAE1MKB7_9FABA|nr:hypothetical protein QN277_026107 [Acacia crassicarpa]
MDCSVCFCQAQAQPNPIRSFSPAFLLHLLAKGRIENSPVVPSSAARERENCLIEELLEPPSHEKAVIVSPIELF